MSAAGEPVDEVTEDAFLDGRLRLRQRRRGYRAGADAVLLAAALDASPGERLIEAGCGAGAALLAAAMMLENTYFQGVELQPAEASLARANVAAHGLQERVEIIEADLFTWRPAATVDGVFLNPPYYDLRSTPPQDAGRAAAFVTPVPLDRWIAWLADWLAGDGVLTLINDAAALGDVLAALEGRLGAAEIAPIFTRPAAPAKRILVRARKGARARPALLPGLLLHAADGAFTAHAEDIFRGRARFSWRIAGEDTSAKGC
jgi:tRNA1(Val) A37 N6-methylase TrmN6